MWILGECWWSIITTISDSGKFTVIVLPRTLPEFRPLCHQAIVSRLASEPTLVYARDAARVRTAPWAACGVRSCSHSFWHSFRSPSKLSVKNISVDPSLAH